MGPLIFIGLPSLGRLPMKCVPPRWLRSLGSDRYDASKWMLRTMSDATYCTVAFLWVVRFVQEGVDVFFSLFGGLCLFGSNAAEGN